MKILNPIAFGLVALISIPSGIAAKRLYRKIKASRPHLSRPCGFVATDFLIPILPWVILVLMWNKTPKSYIFANLIGFILGNRISVIGLTGSIASGKSTASSYLHQKLGYAIIDADKIAREVLEKGTSGYHEVVKTFGSAILDPSTGNIDRIALGSVIFADASRRRALEKITHPRILYRIIRSLIWYRLTGYRVVLDVPLLFESRSPILRFLCNERVLIDVDTPTQRRRIRERNPDMPESQIEDRIMSQMPREKKLQLADYVITNDGTKDEFYARLDSYFR